MKRASNSIYYLVFCWSTLCLAEIDNQFFPVFDFPYQHTINRRSVLHGDLFVVTGHECYVDLKGNGTVPLPELFGKYDLVQAASALVRMGKPNPLPTAWQPFGSLVWDMRGKLHAQGLWFGYEQYLGRDVSIGLRLPLMQVSNQLEFILPNQLRQTLALGVGGDQNVYRVLNSVNQALGFNSYQSQQVALGDLDLYLRWGTVQDYRHKCRHIDFSVMLGGLIPLAGGVDLNAPFPTTFTGYNHRAIYFQSDLNCELKDYWRGGFWFNITKRLSRTQLRRMPAGQELPQFGAIVGEAFVDPGLTVGFSPYVWMEELRDNLGVRGAITFLWHEKDYWRDQRPPNLAPPAQLAEVIKLSGWQAEYVTVGLVYDLQQAQEGDAALPYFYLDLDIPTSSFGADRVAKTFRVSGGFEFNF